MKKVARNAKFAAGGGMAADSSGAPARLFKKMRENSVAQNSPSSSFSKIYELT